VPSSTVHLAKAEWTEPCSQLSFPLTLYGWSLRVTLSFNSNALPQRLVSSVKALAAPGRLEWWSHARERALFSLLHLQQRFRRGSLDRQFTAQDLSRWLVNSDHLNEPHRPDTPDRPEELVTPPLFVQDRWCPFLPYMTVSPHSGPANRTARRDRQRRYQRDGAGSLRKDSLASCHEQGYSQNSVTGGTHELLAANH